MGSRRGGGRCALIRRKQKWSCITRIFKSKRKHLISSAIADNRRPQRSKSSGDLLLSLDGNKRFTKLQQRGKTTPAGRFFFSQTQTNPDTYDIEGTVVQRGST